MSRLARYPIPISSGVNVSVGGDGSVSVKGKLGEISLAGNDNIEVKVDNDEIQVKKVRNTQFARSLEGTFVRRITNMIEGVTEGCSKNLELHGTGYRANIQGNKVNLELGFSHPIAYELPEGITAEAPAQNRLIIKGIDKIRVGQVAADIRKLRPPEPYKGKGVRYAGEHINMKETKKK